MAGILTVYKIMAAKRAAASVYTGITVEQIEDMFYQISICANKTQAKRFSKLDFVTKQKVTCILLRRWRISRRVEMDMDIFMIREVIDDAQQGKFIDLGVY